MDRHLVNFVWLAASLSGWLASSSASAVVTIYPHTKGSTWKYALPRGGFTVTVVASSAHHITLKTSGSLAGVETMKLTSKGWTPAGVGKLRTSSVNGKPFEVKILHVSGVYMPRTKFWKPGYTWHDSMTRMITPKGKGPGDATFLSVRTDFKITGFRTIKVPAGVFHCFSVHLTFHSTERIGASKHGSPSTRTDHLVEYCAKGAGMVEERVGKMVLQKLVSYHIAQ